MVAYKLTINKTEVNRIAKAAAMKVVTDTVRRVLNRAIVGTPVHHGNLRAHNQQRVRQVGLRAIGEVFNDAVYAHAIHKGLPEQTITAKVKKVLRFEINGEVIFAKRVKLPATKGRPWLYRALVEVAGREGYTITKL